MAVLLIALIDLRRLLRERQNLFWLFVAPLVFTLFFGMLLQPSAPRKTVVAIEAGEGERPIAQALANALRAGGVEVRQAGGGQAARFVLVVPDGTTAALEAQKPISLTLKTGADATEEERKLQFSIQKAVVQLSLTGITGATEAAHATGPITIALGSLDVRSRHQSYGFQYSVPAYLVMFVFINLLVSGAGIAEERVTGRLRRLMLTPVTFRQILLAKLLSRFATGWVQMAYMLLLGGFVFHVSWGANPFLLCAFLSVFSLAAASLGLLIGTLFADADKCSALAVWSVMILSPLGGLWWPLDIVSPALRRVASFVPTGWAMQAVDGMMAFGAGALDVAPYAAAFAALFLASFLLAARRLSAQVV